jgi:NAD(P)H-dependent FMN reductase
MTSYNVGYAVDAVLFITPEYNRSIPGALKNAIDWASRPYGTNAFTRKPSAVIGTSPGRIGTAIGQQHLRSILSFCNSPQMNSIEAYIQFEHGLLTEDGEVTNDTTADFFSELHERIPRLHRQGVHSAAKKRLMSDRPVSASGDGPKCRPAIVPRLKHPRALMRVKHLYEREP